MERSRLPDSLGERFRVADAIRLGVPPGRLRALDLARPFHAVRSVDEVAPPPFVLVDRRGEKRGSLEREHLERALDYATRMAEHEFFCGVTAAVLHGLPLPAAVLVRSLDVGVLTPHRLPRSVGIRGHEASPKTTRVHTESISGLRATTPASTWAMLGAMLHDPYDLVAAGDAVVREWRVPAPLASLAELESALAAGRRVGIVKLRDALPRIRTRSASRPETRCRLVLTDAGLPEPLLNHEVVERGAALGCVDLAYPELRIALEYEGEHHLLDPQQWARDIARYDRLREAGWIVIRVTKSELFSSPSVVVERVRRAIRTRA
ncbi:endonuclease domain-containing protein [Microbacterium sp. P04]|uniref:endonuclease domain-containing protein n=1 Tax=Microbacterium sp. P04 TaxID=3366947 RepID=UPI003745F0E1